MVRTRVFRDNLKTVLTYTHPTDDHTQPWALLSGFAMTRGLPYIPVGLKTVAISHAIGTLQGRSPREIPPGSHPLEERSTSH